jgi:hypothetical protein
MKPLVDKKYKLERFQGKGGWTYVRIPELEKHKDIRIGRTKVKGTLDGYEIRKCSLMSSGDLRYFLPIKAEIRKEIQKQEGDRVHVILYVDNDALEIPDEIQVCLMDEPAALTFFNSLSESEKKFYIQWISSAKRDETKVDRLAKTLDRLSRGLKMYDKDY